MCPGLLLDPDRGTPQNRGMVRLFPLVASLSAAFPLSQPVDAARGTGKVPRHERRGLAGFKVQ